MSNTRPEVLPDWATDAVFSAGPIVGQPNKAAPSGGMVQEGFDPTDPVAAEHINFLLNNHGQWIRSLDGYRDQESWWGFTTITGANTGTFAVTGGLVWTNDQTANAEIATNGYVGGAFTGRTARVTPGTANTNKSFNYGGFTVWRTPTQGFYMEAKVKASNIANVDLWFGFVRYNTPDVLTGFREGAFFTVGTTFAGGTNWTCVTGNGVTYGGANSGVAATTNKLGIQILGSSVGNKVNFFIDDVLVHSETTVLPPEAGDGLYPHLSGKCNGATSAQMEVGAVRLIRSAA